MRTNYAQFPPAKWTDAEALHHITGTFDSAVKQHPDIMEPYVVMLAEAADDHERKRIMQQALRETIAARFPC